MSTLFGVIFLCIELVLEELECGGQRHTCWGWGSDEHFRQRKNEQKNKLEFEFGARVLA